MKRSVLFGVITATFVLRTFGQGCEPGPVTGVNASDGTYCGWVHITWNHADRAEFYYVYRDFSQIGFVYGNAYDDYVSGGYTHSYWIQPANQCDRGPGAGDSGYARGGQITGVTASVYTYCNRVHITWNPFPGETNYQVWRYGYDSIYTYLGSTGDTNFDDYDPPGRPGGGLYMVSGDCGPSYGYGSASGVALSSPDDATGVNASDGVYCGCVHITWNWPMMATGFQVQRDGNYVGSTSDASYDDYPGDTSGHSYRVIATNDCGAASGLDSVDSGYAGPGPALPVPGGVTASDGTYGGFVRVNWGWVTGATSYEVFRDGSEVGETSNSTYVDYPGNTSSHLYAVRAKIDSCTGVASASDAGWAGPVYLMVGISFNQLVFSWNTNCVGFGLVWCTNLNVPGTNWTVATPSPAVIGSNYCVTNPIANPGKFYRLRYP